MSSKRPVAPPPIIPGFTYISLLGSGGFSDVYLYEQDRPRRKVAVKVLLSDLKTEGARRRFESEANLMAQLSSHPYIVTIFEAEITDSGHSYLAMEYCSRPSLDVRYRRQRFSVDEVLAVGIQVASAVETAHRAGIAHRDIKPANILVTDYNRPALTDFGISGTLAGDADEDAGMSIPWSPPEQFTGHQVDGVLVDVWALGATLYTLLAGRSPFVLPGADNSQRELISRITNSPVPKLGRADVPESLELALSTAMAKSASSRYSSAHAFALALQRIQAELNLSVTPFEVLEEPRAEENHPDDGFEETRVRSVASIDPDATGNAPTFPARFPAGDTGTTADNATTFNKAGFNNAGFNNAGFNNETVQRPPGLPGFDSARNRDAAGSCRRRRPRRHGQPLQRRCRCLGQRGRQRGRRRRGASGRPRPQEPAALDRRRHCPGGRRRPGDRGGHHPARNRRRKRRTRSASRPRTPWTTAPSRTSPGWPVWPGRPGKSASPGPTRSRNRGTATSGGSTRSRATGSTRPPPGRPPKWRRTRPNPAASRS